jgi:protein-disulfide isomerase
MIRKAMGPVIVAALIAIAGAQTPAAAQSSDEIQALKSEIEALKDGQASIQKSLEDILTILEPIKRRTQNQAQKFEPKDVDLAGATIRGSADAPVTLVEFTDYQCPFCRRHFQTTMPRILKDYVETGKVRYVLKEFPIPSLHPGAPKAAEGALCAGEQGQYWEMHDAIFQDPKAVAPDQLKERATGLGLDVADFSDCLDSGKYEKRVRDDQRAGQELGVRGTPSFLLGQTDPANPDKIKATKFIRGAQGYATFKQAIDELLKPSS